MRPGRGVLGRAMMGRTAEGRSELAELADDSATSADANYPVLPTRSKVNDGETIVPLCFERRGSGTGDHEMQDSRKNTIEFTLATALTQAMQKSAARPNRELRDQA